MTTYRTLLFTSLSVAFLSAATWAATPDLTGQWKMAIGANTVCGIVLAPDGTATCDCATGDRVARWRAMADKLELRSASGEVVGVLYARDGSFAGKRFSDGRTLVLSR